MTAQVTNKEIHLEAGPGNLVRLEISGKLTGEDYDRFCPELESLMEQYDRIRLLVVLNDFEGWDAGALWRDLKFDVKHFNDIEKLAIVGETKWEKGAAEFYKPFTRAEVKYFDHGQLAEAERWIQA